MAQWIKCFLCTNLRIKIQIPSTHIKPGGVAACLQSQCSGGSTRGFYRSETLPQYIKISVIEENTRHQLMNMNTYKLTHTPYACWQTCKHPDINFWLNMNTYKYTHTNTCTIYMLTDMQTHIHIHLHHIYTRTNTKQARNPVSKSTTKINKNYFFKGWNLKVIEEAMTSCQIIKE